MEPKALGFPQKTYPQIVGWLADESRLKALGAYNLHTTLSSCLLISGPMSETPYRRLMLVESFICSLSICGHVLCVLHYARCWRHHSRQAILKTSCFILRAMRNYWRISGWVANFLVLHFRISFDGSMGNGWWERAVTCLHTWRYMSNPESPFQRQRLPHIGEAYTPDGYRQFPATATPSCPPQFSHIVHCI